MNNQEILSILLRVKCTHSEELESETVEFKGYTNEKALHNSKDLVEELSALGNCKGGVVIVGVRDGDDVTHGQWESQLVGISDVDILTTKERLQGKLRPNVDLFIKKIEFESRSYIAIEISKSYESLVSTSSGKVCIREGRSSRPMAPDEIQNAVKSLSSYDWSNEILPHVDVTSLDTGSVESARLDYCRRKKLLTLLNTDAFLESIGVTKNGKLTFGGLVFLGTQSGIEEQLGNFEFRFTWRESNGSLVINDVWRGNLWLGIAKAKGYFEQCNIVSTFKVNSSEFQAPRLDPIAFHEAVVNACVHRDYSASGMISITYDGNGLVISSPGNFYGGVNSANIALHAPRHRNKNLANILMAHQLVDRAGMGVLRMGLGSLRYGRPDPDFREQHDSVDVYMEASYFTSGIVALAYNNMAWGIAELLIVNNVYGTGYVSVKKMIQIFAKWFSRPWDEIVKALNSIPHVELVGTRAGIHIRVISGWKHVYGVSQTFRVTAASQKLVKLFTHLRSHGDASNADLSLLLSHKHSSQTSDFLRKADFVERSGNGPNSRWSLKPEWAE